MAHPMGESKLEGRRAGPGQEHRPRGVVRQRQLPPHLNQALWEVGQGSWSEEVGLPE